MSTHIANKLTDPLVYIEYGRQGHVRVLKHGDVAVCWIWELAEPTRSVIPMTDPSDMVDGPACYDLFGHHSDDCIERSSSFDVSERRAGGREAMLMQLATDRPLVVLYLDEFGEFWVLQNGDVDVRVVEDGKWLGKITAWRVERRVIHDLVTGKRTWFHPQDPLGSDRDGFICPGNT